MGQDGTGADAIWMTRVIDRFQARTLGRPVLVGCCTLGLVPVVLTALFVALPWTDPTVEFLSAHLLAMLVPVVAPGGVWYWDSRVFPRFIDQMAALATDPDEVKRLGTAYKQRFSHHYWWFTLPWTTLIVGLVALNREYFTTLGVTGLTDPAFVVYLAFAAWWGLVTGIGFHGAITAIRAIRAVGRLELDIDPLHPDGLGGLSAVGYLAIWTTMLISVGSLTLPLAFLLGVEGGYSVLVYLAVGLYVVVIAVSFVYPTVYVNRRAQEIREAELERRRTKIRQLQAQAADVAQGDDVVDETATMDEVAKRLEIQRLRDEFNEYADVSLYPLSIGIIIRLLSSIFLPIFFILFETVLGQFL
ncbi:hypothetical protein ACKVMT_05425 [Halobacteriales archaeon Cl-PHB]